MAPSTRISLMPNSYAWMIGSLIRDARLTIGWSQDELAERAKTSQTMIWRIETGGADRVRIDVMDRVVRSLGMRWELELRGRHLDERRDQLDPVHAALVGSLGGRLARGGWEVETEVPTGGESPTGWIDLAAYRESDASMFLGEVKADLPDIGGMQRQIGWYEQSAGRVAQRLGWRPTRIAVGLVCLDSRAISERLAANRDLLRRAFSGRPSDLARWLLDCEAAPPAGRTIVVTDLAGYKGLGLRRSRIHGPERPTTYEGYADAAAYLRRRRPRAAKPRSRQRAA
ncbi:MAG TPA: helix-turn-helix transcriptional regulator [Candidatus Limnocylindrales bacterium]|nr:helix-turn-helix transcriptional regulator [Candidatus Limnocylindrales bacterium]